MSETKEPARLFKDRSVTEITTPIIKHIESATRSGLLDLGSDYSVPNALNAAYYLIKEEVKSTKDNGYKPALEVCTPESIQNCLRKMVIQGLNPAKKQVYFIVTGNKLTMLPSYFGDVAKAIRYGRLTADPVCNIVYEGDEFETVISTETGFEWLKFHKRGGCRDMDKIKGAYAMATSESGTKYFEYMDMAAIRRAWAQGLKLMRSTSSTVQENFTDRAVKRTVIRRICTYIFNTSSDYSILNDFIKEGEPTDIDHEEIIEIKEIESPNQPQAIEGSTAESIIQVKAPEKVKRQTEAAAQPELEMEGFD